MAQSLQPFCVYVCVYSYVYRYVYVHVHIHALCVEVEGQPWALFLRSHPPCLLSLHLELEPGADGLGKAVWAEA